MKIAILAPHYPPDFEGGTELVARAQARELAILGHEVKIVAGTDRAHAGEDVVRTRVDGLPVSTLPRKASEPYDLDLLRPRIAELAASEVEGAELVHLHQGSTLASDLARRLPRSVPVIVTLHDFLVTCPRFFRLPPVAGIECPERGDFEPCVRCLEPDAGGMTPVVLRSALVERARSFEAELSAAAVILVPSRAFARRIASLLGMPEERLRVVEHGLCRALDRQARTVARFTGVLGGRAIRVLHCGNLCREKGTLDLVQSLSKLPFGSVDLALAGRILEPGFERELRAAAGEMKLVFHGAYDERELARLAASADLAALPSRAFESYGLVLDEVLALGLPAWVSDRGAPPERLGGAGRVLPAGNSPAWTRAFLDVLADPSSLEEERERVPSRLRTAADAARALESLYEGALPRSASRRSGK